MPVRTANAQWEKNLMEGKGTMRLGSGALEVPYSFGTRFGEVPGTNPEELIGAAHAGCFSMAFAHELSQGGFIPDSIKTKAEVTIQSTPEGFRITDIMLKCEGKVPGIDEKKFLDTAENAKRNCPVSRALAGVNIKLEASLVH